MPIYNCVVHTSARYKFDIEAKDQETAEEMAGEKVQEEHAPDNIDDVEVFLSDDQYTDQQELADRERGIE